MRTHGTTTSTSHDGFRRVEVITGVGRRRRWTDEEKAWIVAESLDPATSVSAVARRYGLHASQLFVWRQQLAAPAARQAPGFVPVLAAEEDAATPPGMGARIEIALGPAVVRVGPDLGAAGRRRGAGGGPAGRALPAQGRGGRLPQGHGRAGRPGAAGAAGRPVRGRRLHLPPQTGGSREDFGLRRDRPVPVREEAGGRAALLAVAGGGG